MPRSTWLHIEPYVHVAVNGEQVLLYNTLTGAAIENGHPPVVRLVKRLRSHKNLFVVKLTPGLLRDGRIAAFVERVREAFIGDLLEQASSQGKPIEMMPRLHIQRRIRQTESGVPSVHPGEEVLGYLSEVTLYITNACGRHCPACHHAYRQFLACTRGTAEEQELPVAAAAKLLNEAKASGLTRVNVVGGDVFGYTRFKELVQLLTPLQALKVYVSHYANVPEGGDKLELLALDRNAELRVLVDLPVDEERLRRTLGLLHGRVAHGVDVVLRCERDLDAAAALAREVGTDRCRWRACYDGTNSAFVTEVLSLRREDIIDARPTLGDVFARMALNPLDFGRLIVASDGTVRSNVNARTLGHLGRDSLRALVYRELVDRCTWRRSRTAAQPCRTCAYNLLCPPLTSYEAVLGRSNLCDVQAGKGAAT